MKIQCDREKLWTSFQTAAAVVPVRSPKPILQNVKLNVSSEATTLIATDLEVGIRVDVQGIEVDVPGEALLPVNRFGPILRESVDEKLSIEADPQGCMIRGKRSEFRLPGANPQEFPEVVSFSEDKYHEVPARLMKELIRRTLFATDTESSRYALGGVLLEIEDNRIIAVGTDGRRLAKMEGPCQAVGGHSVGDAQTIVPTRAMQLIERTLSDADAEIQLAARSNDVLIKNPRATIYSRLVEGRFPKWRDVFPKRENVQSIELTVGTLFAVLRQASIVTSDESRGVAFSFGDGLLVLSTSTAEVGQARVEVPISYDGPPIDISLDHRYVADFLKVLNLEKTFSVELTDSESAAVFRTEEGYGYVVMPLAKER